MDATHSQATRVRWLVAGAFLPSPSGCRFLFSADSFAAQLSRAARGLNVAVPDRLGASDSNAYTVSFDGLGAFQLSQVVDSIPELRDLWVLRDAVASGRAPDPEVTSRLAATVGRGRLASALAEAFRGPRLPQDARATAISVIDEALFGTARDILQQPVFARLESAWRGVQWLHEHCPDDAGMDIEVLDVGPDRLLDALTTELDVRAIQRPDACFILEPITDVGTLQRLAALGEQAWLPMVVAVPPALPEMGADAWARLRREEASRWLCAVANPVVAMAEQHGPVRRECFTSPALAMAALLSASFRDTGTFARLVGPGSGTRAPAVWQPRAGSTVGTEASLSLREQERLAAQGVSGVSGWWDSDAVSLAAAPTVYGGRDAVPLPAQLLTGRLVRLAQEIAELLPPNASTEAVSALFSRAAERFLATGRPGLCRLDGRVVSLGSGERGVQVRAALKPELAGTYVQLDLSLPLEREG